MSVNNMFSPEEIAAMKSGGGVSKSFAADSQGVVRSSMVTTHCENHIGSGGWGDAPSIETRTQKVSRPSIKGSGGYVTSPNLERFNDQAVARDQAEAAKKAQQEKDRQAQAPDAMQSRIEYLERSLKKLQKQLKEINNNGD